MNNKLTTRIVLPIIFIASIIFPASGVILAARKPAATSPSVSIGPSVPRVLLYVIETKSGLESLRRNVTNMDIVAPQTYSASPDGTLSGKPNKEVLALAANAGASVMPLVFNKNFSQDGIHNFLSNPNAQSKLLLALVSEAREKRYMGYQYDFEHIDANDRDLYTAFVKRSADIFHGAGLQLSVAVGPQHSDKLSEYAKGSWDNWTGAFDYKAIGEYADFVSIMAYDDGLSVGPTASLPWVKDVLDYTLERIPAHKVSLGVPFYAWVRDTKTQKRVSIVGYPAIEDILDSGAYKSRGWSSDLGVSWVTYVKNKKTLTAWYEDEKSFKQKLKLVTDNDLHGFSAWVLGLEDPDIWNQVLAMRATRDGVAYR